VIKNEDQIKSEAKNSRRISHVNYVSAAVTLIGVLSFASSTASQPTSESDHEVVIKACNNETGEAAISACAELIKFGSAPLITLASAYNNRGSRYIESKKYDLAVKDFDEAILLNPRLAEAFCNRGIVYVNQKKYDLALRDFEKAISLRPDYANAYYSRAAFYDQTAQYERANTDYDKAIDINQDFAHAFINRGINYKMLGNFKRAIQDYDRAIELQPNNSYAFANRGNAYYALRMTSRALADYDKAISIEPEFGDAYANRCRAKYNSLVFIKQALQDCHRALKIMPENPRYFVVRGFAYIKLHRYRDAIADFSAALARDSSLAGAFYGRGLAYLQTKDFARGNADLASAKAINPNVRNEHLSQGIQW
jgi:tetratricopeptide (TPR) repeat protein